MRARSAADRELVTRPLVGTAHLVLLTAALLASGYLMAVVVAWVS